MIFFSAFASTIDTHERYGPISKFILYRFRFCAFSYRDSIEDCHFQVVTIFSNDRPEKHIGLFDCFSLIQQICWKKFTIFFKVSDSKFFFTVPLLSDPIILYYCFLSLGHYHRLVVCVQSHLFSPLFGENQWFFFTTLDLDGDTRSEFFFMNLSAKRSQQTLKYVTTSTILVKRIKKFTRSSKRS